MNMNVENCLVVKGIFIKTSMEFSIANVYAFLDSGDYGMWWVI